MLKIIIRDSKTIKNGNMERVKSDNLIVHSDLSILNKYKDVVTILDICYNELEEIPSIVSEMNKLNKLMIAGNNINNISILSDCTQIEHLHINDNKITDISPLSNHFKLQYFTAYNNNISSLKPLKKCSRLKFINICINKIKDFPCFFYNLETLHTLKINNNDANLKIDKDKFINKRVRLIK